MGWWKGRNQLPPVQQPVGDSMTTGPVVSSTETTVTMSNTATHSSHTMPQQATDQPANDAPPPDSPLSEAGAVEITEIVPTTAEWEVVAPLYSDTIEVPTTADDAPLVKAKSPYTNSGNRDELAEIVRLYSDTAASTGEDSVTGEALEELYSRLDRYGFIREPGSVERRNDKARQRHRRQIAKRDSRRAMKWTRMAVSDGAPQPVYHFERSNTFILRVYKGIPDSWRTVAWRSLLRMYEEAPLTDDDTLLAEYAALRTLESAHVRQIDLDIERTMRNHILYRRRYSVGQCSLFHLLCAYAHAHPEVGYCQGMSTAAAFLSMYYADEDAYVTWRHLFERCQLDGLFQPGFPALMEAMYVQTQLLVACAPSLAHHLVNVGVIPEMYLTRWFLTLFTDGSLPHRTALRVWDILMLRGFDTLICVSTGLLIHFQDRLMVSNFETISQFLVNTLPFKNEDDDDALFLGIVRRLLERRKYGRLREQLREEYRAQHPILPQ